MKEIKTEDALQQFGAILRTSRKSKNLSQEELAHLCQLDRTYIGGIERGERNVSLLNILKICLALETAPKTLFAEINIKELSK